MYRRELAGGGVLFHTMVHLLDAVLWALGNPRPVRATASSYQKLARMNNPPPTWEGPVEACDIEDFNIGLVHFADGSTMSIESNWLMHPRTRPSGAELLGDWGMASLRPLRLELEEEGEIVDATPELPTDPPMPSVRSVSTSAKVLGKGARPWCALARCSTSSASWTPSTAQPRQDARSK
ncbi:MAG: hypothetical protein VX293_13045 [Candidatus Latescibacterota bacterium]|nr:hypothetical protein [Candidatus Latescibacterota bacterium]